MPAGSTPVLAPPRIPVSVILFTFEKIVLGVAASFDEPAGPDAPLNPESEQSLDAQGRVRLARVDHVYGDAVDPASDDFGEE